MKTREAVHMGMDNHEIIILAEVIKYLSLYRTKWVIWSLEFCKMLNWYVSDFIRKGQSFVRGIGTCKEEIICFLFCNCKMDEEYFESYIWVWVWENNLVQVIV